VSQAPPAPGPAPGAVALAALRNRREAALLAVPSVERLALVLAERCRDASWVRTAVTGLDRFRAAVVGDPRRLEDLLAEARADVGAADQALAAFAATLSRHAPLQVETLAFGAKTWFRVGGVGLACRPVVGDPAPPPGRLRPAGSDAPGADPELRLVLLALVGSGLTADELLGLRLADAGLLGPDGSVTSDPLASPLALEFTPDDRPAGERRLTFLPAQARGELTAALASRVAAAEQLGPDSPLLRGGPGLLEAARHHHERLIDAGNDANVTTCRITGDFFRAWGMPGARFRPVPPAGASREDTPE
jgi:hypothetical protein